MRAERKLSTAEEKRLAKKRRVIEAYKRKFGGNDEDTRIIMRDLERRCFLEASPYAYGMSGMDLAYRTGLSDVYRHIKHRERSDLDKLKLTQDDE